MIMWNKEKLQKRGDHIFWDGKELPLGRECILMDRRVYQEKEGRFSRRCTVIKAYLHW